MEAGSEVTQLCPTVCDPTDCSLPGSSIHGISQARILEWVAISFSRRSSQPRESQIIHQLQQLHTHTHTHTHTRAQECAHEKKDGVSTHNIKKCQQLVNLAEEYNAVHWIILPTFLYTRNFLKIKKCYKSLLVILMQPDKLMNCWRQLV